MLVNDARCCILRKIENTQIILKIVLKIYQIQEISLELVSKELNHFGVIAGLFRQIGGHSSRFVLFLSL